MKRLFLVLVCVSMFTTGVLFGPHTASAAEPIVVVTPPPGGPIPIPYPNTGVPSPAGRSALTGFLRAQVATSGIISVQTDGTIE